MSNTPLSPFTPLHNPPLPYTPLGTPPHPFTPVHTPSHPFTPLHTLLGRSPPPPRVPGPSGWGGTGGGGSGSFIPGSLVCISPSQVIPMPCVAGGYQIPAGAHLLGFGADSRAGHSSACGGVSACVSMCAVPLVLVVYVLPDVPNVPMCEQSGHQFFQIVHSQSLCFRYVAGPRTIPALFLTHAARKHCSGPPRFPSPCARPRPLLHHRRGKPPGAHRAERRHVCTATAQSGSHTVSSCTTESWLALRLRAQISWCQTKDMRSATGRLCTHFRDRYPSNRCPYSAGLWFFFPLRIGLFNPPPPPLTACGRPPASHIEPLAVTIQILCVNHLLPSVNCQPLGSTQQLVSVAQSN